MTQPKVKRIFLILGDQLSLSHPFLTGCADQPTDLVLMIESLPRADHLPYHPQKLMFVFACMRRFAHEVRRKKLNFRFEYVEFSPLNFSEAVDSLAADEVHIVAPVEPNVMERIMKSLQTKCVVHPNPFFLADPSFLPAKPPYLLENFYRAMRLKMNVLVKDGQPEGGRWNFDEENRRPPDAELSQHPPRDFLSEDWCDDLDREIYAAVEKELRKHLPKDRFGKFVRPPLPTHHAAAREFLRKFVADRLALFGPYEDAMISESAGLFHSGFSPLMNLQVLSAKEVVDAISEAPASVPLASKEGFIRQVIGWREFVRLIYLRHREDYKGTNFFGFSGALPPLFWGGKTEMNCLHQVVRQVETHGYSHHITRLMVLGNFALLSHTDPHEVNRWFWAVYLDAFEWVVTPNVLGMSQFADGGVFATKPYVSGANYINKMSRFCKGCRYDPKKTLGDDACPFNALYWDFIGHTQKTQAKRASFARRMGMMWSVWTKKSDDEKEKIQQRAEHVRELARKGKL
ncbi:MAG: hypothetical protein RIR26_243 [Pseudomonadota bacterium]|jgi:deoxyribodipyrimidine photolyase-related protein